VELNAGFTYPIPVMKETVILDPLKTNAKTKMIYLRNYEIIKAFLNDCFKSKLYISYDEILNNLNMTELDYINAIRASLTNS
jgi:hypothetical protein